MTKIKIFKQKKAVEFAMTKLVAILLLLALLAFLIILFTVLRRQMLDIIKEFFR